ncbi:Tetrahydrodipicolinate N-succinyltransferase (DapD) [Fructobacillus cardui]|uniref:2,3,4,5-tetrahydropyridine-2,6-dicarboxylate N-acetyltransferase n=1 Tax=Fructobacillus cardui TaxID=2893170 RepID=UPI002DAB32CD|nr:Tetrahydrodipicolinate N-succinyltransferase (DapD) [Fructobacillus cardui]
MTEMDTAAIINYLATSKKKTPAKVTLAGDLAQITWPNDVQAFIEEKTGTVFGDMQVIQPILDDNQAAITDYHVELIARNSGVPLLNTQHLNARIEPGALIRDRVQIDDQVVVMMGAVINIGAKIGVGSMIDMGAVLGGRAEVGKNCHIGAGAVLAGVIEPASAEPVRVGDGALVGANAVVIEGVQVGAGAVVAAGAIVTEDVPERTVVAGVPAKVIKQIDAQTEQKTALVAALRDL